jgi:signal transduction histidine kinase
MTRLRDFLREGGGNALIVLILVAAEIEVFATDRASWTAALFAPFWVVPLLLRHRSALATALVPTAVLAVESFVQYDATESSMAFIVIVVAFVLLGLHEPRRRALVGGVVGFALVFPLASNDPTFTASDPVIVGLFVWGPLIAGMAIRDRTELRDELAAQNRRLEHAREEAARLAVAEERARIAAELHDVIAGAIDAMTAQAESAQVLVLEDPTGARAPIEHVEEAGREALAETRRLLGVLRRDMTSEPETETHTETVPERAPERGETLVPVVEG